MARDDTGLESGAGRLGQALLQARYGADLACQADLADGGGRRVNRLIAEAGRGGKHKSQIGGRLVQLQAADDVHIRVRHPKIHAAALFQHGQHEICPVKIKAVRRAAGDVEVRPRDKRLNFCQNRARTLHHAGHARAGGI